MSETASDTSTSLALPAASVTRLARFLNVSVEELGQRLYQPLSAFAIQLDQLACTDSEKALKIESLKRDLETCKAQNTVQEIDNGICIKN